VIQFFGKCYCLGVSGFLFILSGKYLFILFFPFPSFILSKRYNFLRLTYDENVICEYDLVLKCALRTGIDLCGH
jgi:hypothetical protein